ncbi:MAG: GAF domain-containing protein [Anaerolineales bacterium]
MRRDLLDKVEGVVSTPHTTEQKLLEICRLLVDEVEHYDWVGFYLVDPAVDHELVLGPYVGEPTEHTRIAFGAGICGQAAANEATFIIQDVTQESNYLSCSPAVQSEIVVPIFAAGKVIGELDIDSHALAPFTEDDHLLLEAIAERVSQLLAPAAGRST